MCDSERRTGFTLIELLAVLTIIGLLAALLIPSLVQARHRANQAACASNLHQIGLALRMHAADWDGHYAPDNADALQTRSRLVWGLLTPYTQGAGVFHCPEERGPLDRALGYQYRAALEGTRLNPLRRPPRPGSGTVVAWCEQHTERSGDGWALDARGSEIGPLIVVREDGSTGRVQADQVTLWRDGGGGWRPSPPLCPVGAVCTARFPGEEWPLEFER